MRTYPSEVYEIHNAFDIAGENILLEAQRILKECENTSIEKGNRLNKIGFNQTPEAKTATEIRRKEKEAQDLSALIIYYKENYPSNKFITETKVNDICEKWGLVRGDITLYKGFVPEKNLREIESFGLNENERNNLIFSITESGNGNVVLPRTELTIDDLTPFGIDYFKNRRGLDYCFITKVDGQIDIQLFKQETGNIFSPLKFVRAQLNLGRMQICAPYQDMDTTGLKLNGVILEKFYPDPIVLISVKGGYLIITAWGDEAFDENVLQHK